MAYVVFARKYRPQRFADLVGQDHVARTLANAIRHERVHHAYLFTGARGLGKTTTARILAKALVCVEGPTAEPCNVCEACVSVTEGRCPDVLEIDGASNNSVDDIRRLREQVHYLPQTTRRKVYIIDEVHMLSGSAFNALLKTLEEPPPHVNFVFATTEPHKVLPTILSRVNRLDLRRLSTPMLAAHLRTIVDREGLAVDASGLERIARAADGSVRDALTLLDQVVAFAEDPRAVRDEEVRRVLGHAEASAVIGVLAAVVDRQAEQALRVLDEVFTSGLDLVVFARQVLQALRDLMVIKLVPEPGAHRDWIDATADVDGLASLAARIDPTTVGQLFDRFAAVVDEVAGARERRLVLDMGVLELVHAPALPEVAALIAELRGAPGTPRPPRSPQGGGGGGSTSGPGPGASHHGREPAGSGELDRRPRSTAASATPTDAAPSKPGPDLPPSAAHATDAPAAEHSAPGHNAASPPAAAATPSAPVRAAPPPPLQPPPAAVPPVAVPPPTPTRVPEPGSREPVEQPHEAALAAPRAAEPAPATARTGLAGGPPPPPAVLPDPPAFERWRAAVAAATGHDPALAATCKLLGLDASQLQGATGEVRLCAPPQSLALGRLRGDADATTPAAVAAIVARAFGPAAKLVVAAEAPRWPDLPSLALDDEHRRAEHQRAMEFAASEHPLVRRLSERLGAALVRVTPLEPRP